MSTSQVLILSSATGAVVGLFGVLVAALERRRGSGRWLVPGTFRVLLIILSLVRLAVLA